MKLDSVNNISLIAIGNDFTIWYILQIYECVKFIQEVMMSHCYIWWITKAVININTDIRQKTGMEQNATSKEWLEIYNTILFHKYEHLSQRVRNSQLGVIKEISFSKSVTGWCSIFLEDNIINELGCRFLCHIHVLHYVCNFTTAE